MDYMATSVYQFSCGFGRKIATGCWDPAYDRKHASGGCPKSRHTAQGLSDRCPCYSCSIQSPKINMTGLRRKYFLKP